MYCEGGRSRNGELAERARPRIGRLALEPSAPIVPVAILGSHQVRN
jgi:1-acyl-sn-glycerol-3-phosphate acyltransferase